MAAHHTLVFGGQRREGGVGIGAQRRDRHQPDQLQSLGVGDQVAHRVDFGRITEIDATARRVAIEADLQEDPYRRGPHPVGDGLLHTAIQRGGDLGGGQ